MIDDNDRIIVVDSYPGAGKTTWAIEYINSLPEDIRVIYITPYLSEVTRILNSCKQKNFIQPSAKRGKGSKLNHLIQLIINEQNIVSTHALFTNINDNLIDALIANNYVLILDEVFQTVERFDLADNVSNPETRDNITKQDVQTLKDQGHIKVEDDFRITWINPDKPLNKYSNLINLSERGLIYLVNETLLLWSFPVEVFQKGIFSKIFILTHRFESQLQAYYYKYFEIEYAKYVVYKKNDHYEIEKSSTNTNESLWKKEIKKLIHIVNDNKLNKIGDVYEDNRKHKRTSALSKSWYANHSDMIKLVSKSLVTYFQSVAKSKSDERLWTCFKEELPKLKGKNVSVKSWLACNARATNEYGEKTVLAYLINRYVDPFYDDFFEKKGIQINQDEFAVSEMIQWIWRSAIRNGKEITLYLPSQRMRTLLIKYLNDEIIEF